VALNVAVVVLCSYLLGSISFAYLAVKVYAGKDLRREGSGNLGGRNASRILGKSRAVAVIVLDIGKGALAVLLAQQLVGAHLWVSFLAMTAALLGHNYSMFMRLQGGKGLAAGFGALLVINPLLLATLVAAALITLAVTRDVYKAALAMIILLLPAVLYFYPGAYTTWLAALAAAAVVMSRHVKHLVKPVEG